MVSMKIQKYFVFDPVVMKRHRNDPWDVQICKKCSLNYEFQNIKFQIGNGFLLSELVGEILFIVRTGIDINF